MMMHDDDAGRMMVAKQPPFIRVMVINLKA